MSIIYAILITYTNEYDECIAQNYQIKGWVHVKNKIKRAHSLA